MPTVVYRKKTGDILRMTFNPKALERKSIDRRIYEVTEFAGSIPEDFRDYSIINGVFKKRAVPELNTRRIVVLQRRVLELQRDFKEAKKQKLEALTGQIADDITSFKKKLAKLGVQ